MMVVNLADFEPLARERLSDSAWAYLSGGAADEHTLKANRAAWDAVKLRPRCLRPLAGLHTRVKLLGREHAWPVLLAPIAYQRLANDDGELATALAASAQATGLVLSTLSSVSMEAVAQAMGGETPWWFQLYWQASPGATLQLVRRAERAGCEALVLTVDAPLAGVRDRERRAGFVLPPGVAAAHASAPSGELPHLLACAPTWADLEWLRRETHLPVMLKGVHHPADAARAMASGACGLVVSNHGGRVLDGLPATAELLPALRDAVGPAACLLVDGGIRRGTDVIKALALGANAVLLGRPYVQALAANGAMGVAQALAILRDEFIAALALCGLRSPEEITRDALWHATVTHGRDT